MKKKNISKSGDLKDSKKDQQKLQPAPIIIDIPEVKDIPGQEYITVPQLTEMQDITVSSAGEEGEGIVDDLNTGTEKIVNGESDLTPAEKRLLKQSAGHQPNAASADFNKMTLDELDNDGEPLNEKSIRQDRSGGDLDTPGTELDDEDEKRGGEDEENNIYSQRD